MVGQSIFLQLFLHLLIEREQARQRVKPKLCWRAQVRMHAFTKFSEPFTDFAQSFCAL